jgi:quercetin dioxygenase-like cupin family protein
VLIGDKTMIVWWSMKAGAHAAAHKHPHEQAFWMLSGRMDLRMGAGLHRPPHDHRLVADEHTARDLSLIFSSGRCLSV